jgi:cellulose synthase/poly-beta-1,6-N-acetylglucosamine synthase-like glycosyltransferase
MRNAETLDEPCPLTAPVPQSGLAPLIEGKAESRASCAQAAVSVCVACCSTTSMPHAAVLAVARALKSVAIVRTILLSATGSEATDGVEVIAVAHGTKLSKIRHLADVVPADLFCICDPDLSVEDESCRRVLQQAMANVRVGREVVAFGIVEGRDDGTLLSRVVAVDKWLSHHVLRRLLWTGGIGITLPGQFLIVSPGLLRGLEPAVDSYLDDLYLGWIARRRDIPVHRVPVVVGTEDSRLSWLSLLAQRVRWMRGLACLFRRLASHPDAIGLLAIHYLAYHGLPIVAMVAVVLLTVVNPLAGCCVFFSLAALLSFFSGRPFFAAVAFLGVFPFVHLLATLLWCIPVSRSLLTRR